MNNIYNYLNKIHKIDRDCVSFFLFHIKKFFFNDKRVKIMALSNDAVSNKI